MVNCFTFIFYLPVQKPFARFFREAKLSATLSKTSDKSNDKATTPTKLSVRFVYPCFLVTKTNFMARIRHTDWKAKSKAVINFAKKLCRLRSLSLAWLLRVTGFFSKPLYRVDSWTTTGQHWSMKICQRGDLRAFALHDDCVVEDNCPPFCVNPLSVVEGRRLRLVKDLRHVHKYLVEAKFKYEDL